MKYLCTNCNYIYDTAFGDDEEEVNIGQELDMCPVCEEYDTFHGIEEEVNYIDDNSRLESIEIEHFPEVIIEGDKLVVSVGNEIHPMGEDHRIASVSLYDEYGDLIEEKYLELEEEPRVVFDFDDLDEYEIRVKCSQHGVWGKRFVN
ncbi:MAG: desulfoferrodoxin family protein [Candidatus Gracilibacteria bacterium]|nr:desulfoferrodoxin family protein [Candidatus Gracilibacteria bacterium]